MVMRSPLFGNGSGRIHNRTRHHPCASTQRSSCIPRRSRRFPRCAVPLATGRNPLRFGIVDPWANDRRPQRELTALPVPAQRRASAAARRVPAAQGRPRSVPWRGWTPDERRPRFRVVGPPRHRQQARHPRRGRRERIPHAHPSMPRSGRPAPHRPSHLTGRRDGRRGAHPPDGMHPLHPDSRPPPGTPHPLLRPHADLLGMRQSTAGPAPHPRPVRLPRARLVCRTSPVPPRAGGSGGWRPAGPCRASGRARAGVRAPLGGIQAERRRFAGPVRAHPAAQVGVARARRRTTGGARCGRVSGVMGRRSNPGLPGVYQGGGAGDPGSGARVHRRRTVGAPCQAGAHHPAGRGAASALRHARDAGLDLMLHEPFRGGAGHPHPP